MNEKEVHVLFEEIYNKFKELGYKMPTVVFNTDWSALKTFGQCSYVEHEKFKIDLSKNHWSLAPEENIKNTIVHELIHALDRNKHGHGPIWKKLAAKIGPEFDVVITRLSQSSEAEMQHKKSKAVAMFTCNSCGSISYAYRRTGAYKSEGVGYHCAKCGEGSVLLFKKLK